MAASRDPGQFESSFEVLYRAVGESPILTDIYRNAFDAEWPDLQGQMSFVTRYELSVIKDGLGLLPGARLADLGCGAGGPSLWIADACEASVLGVDSSSAAIAFAERCRGARDGATYRVADMTDTGLPGQSFDAAVSFDALQALPDPRLGVTEAARLLLPGKRFAFTTWETSPPAGVPEQATARFVEDYRPVLEARGFDVVHHGLSPGWKERQLTVSRDVLANEDALRRELGSAACDLLCAEAREDALWLEATQARRVIAIAERTTP